MLSNTVIKEQLNTELDKAISDFEVGATNQNLVSGFKKLLDFKFEAYKENLKSEVKTNLRLYWTNPENGLNPTQQLDAILFEHYIPDTINLKAVAYGIIDWKDKEVDHVDVDMGYEIDFATNFEQIEGITLDFFNPYLDSFDHDENSDLAHCYRLKGLIAIHEVFYELYQENEFDGINKNDEFYLLVGEHDSFCYAVLSIKKE